MTFFIQAMQIVKTASAEFDSSNSIIHFNKNAILEYKYDSPTPQKLSLYRKLSDIVYDVETALNCNDNDDDTINDNLSLQQVIDIISNASASIRKYISEYIEFLFNEFSIYLLFNYFRR